MKAELSILKAEQATRDYKEKGNSLFGEVSKLKYQDMIEDWV